MKTRRYTEEEEERFRKTFQICKLNGEILSKSEVRCRLQSTLTMPWTRIEGRQKVIDWILSDKQMRWYTGFVVSAFCRDIEDDDNIWFDEEKLNGIITGEIE